MKKKLKNNFLAVWLIVICVTQTISHFTKMPDFISGSLTGTGLGLVILSLIKLKQNPIY